MQNKQTSQNQADILIHWLREYATKRIDSLLIDEKRCFPPHLFLDFGRQGIFGMHVPHEYGGLDLEVSDMLRVVEQIAAIDLTLATLIVESVQSAHTLRKYASQEKKDRYLPLLAKGQILMAGAMTESAAGSHPRAMAAKAVPNSTEGWVITGSKRWVGLGSWANLIAVYVQQMDECGQWLGMSGFIVEQGAPGLRIGPESVTMGIRGLAKHTIYLDHVSVTANDMLGAPGEGMEVAQDNMMYIRLCLAAAAVGGMKRSMQLMYRYASRRQMATGRLLDNPVTQVHLSDLATVVHTIEVFVRFIARQLDKDPSALPEECLVTAKVVGSEQLSLVTDRLVQMLGARGYEESSGVAQLFRDARTFRIFEGPTEALNMYIGSRVFASNSTLKNFFYDTIKQPQLFDELQRRSKELLAHKANSSLLPLLSQNFSYEYWVDHLSGQLVSSSLLLGVLKHVSLLTPSAENERSCLWAAEQYHLAQQAATNAANEKLSTHLLAQKDIEKTVLSYIQTIGDLEQKRIEKETEIDPLLALVDKTEKEAKAMVDFSEQQSEDYHIYAGKISLNKPEVGVHQLFESAVVNMPEAVAVAINDQTITYQQLNEKANKLAHYLVKQNANTTKPIGIYLDRSIEMIISVLAALKAGFPYLPLDINYPRERIAFMLEDSLASIVISRRELAEQVVGSGRNLILTDEWVDLFENEPASNLSFDPALSTLGYVIYTSGSTGRPKGVALAHKALVNLLLWNSEKIPGKRTVLQFASIGFDMSFLEIFSALSVGGKLVLLEEQDRADIFRLANIVKQHAIEVMMLPVVYLHNLVEHVRTYENFSSVKEIVTAGEQLIINDSVRKFFRVLNNCRLLNYYGPTETHVSLAYELPKDIEGWPTHPAIGYPIDNAKAIVLDNTLCSVAVGQIGELFLGGACLAEGYINRPDLTQERFVTIKSSCGRAERWYRTGDLVKELGDGSITFVGREDNQIKIRGHRIELEEIETVCLAHATVKEAVVVKRETASKGVYLEAFFVLKEGLGKSSNVESLEQYLKDKLPIYMVPDHITLLEQMPLTSSGKIDRLTLENIETGRPFYEREIVLPTSAIEQYLVSAMKELFGYEISTSDGFLALGGNSLLVMGVVSKLKETLGLEVPAYLILSEPTLSDVAKKIEVLR